VTSFRLCQTYYHMSRIACSYLKRSIVHHTTYSPSKTTLTSSRPGDKKPKVTLVLRVKSNPRFSNQLQTSAKCVWWYLMPRPLHNLGFISINVYFWSQASARYCGHLAALPHIYCFDINTDVCKMYVITLHFLA